MSVDSVARDVLACVCLALQDAGKPVCGCYATVGRPVVPPCCECDETGSMGHAIVQVEETFPVDQDLNRVSRISSCKRGSRAVDLTVLVTRCYPTIDESGNIDTDAIDEAASGVHDDIDTLWRAFSCCSEMTLAVRRIAVDSDPQAGCSLLVGQVTVLLP